MKGKGKGKDREKERIWKKRQRGATLPVKLCKTAVVPAATPQEHRQIAGNDGDLTCSTGICHPRRRKN